MKKIKADYNAVKDLVKESKKITILTGAGISTESGIKDFRSKDGLWSEYKAVSYQEFVHDAEKRKYYWKYKFDTISVMLNALPNESHEAIVRLYRHKKLFKLITQNIDGLHEASGIPLDRIIRLHGTNKEAVCLSCGKIFNIKTALDMIRNGNDDPKCHECGGFLKPNTISFGQSLNQDNLLNAEIASVECDLFMALGTSLQVSPACGFVEVANRAGRPVVIINRDTTPYDDIAAFCINDSLSKVLSDIVD